MLSNYPAPYRQPLFNALGAALDARGCRLHLYYAAPSGDDRRWDVDTAAPLRYEVHVDDSGGTLGAGRHGFHRFRYAGLIPLVRRLRPHMVLADGFSPGAMRLALMRRPPPFGMWGGAIDDEGGWIAPLRRVQRRWLVHRCRVVVALSSRSRCYVEALGMPADRTFLARNCAAPLPLLTPDPARDDAPRLLVVGSLTVRKGVDRALQAVRRLCDAQPRATRQLRLQIAGSGPQETALRAQAERLQLAAQVDFLGQLSADELSRCYRSATAMLFPTRHDIWGLVVNEAMQAGLPVLCSYQAGAADDLIRDGSTGYRCDFDRPDQVAERLAQLIQQPGLARAMGLQAREHVERVASVQASAVGWLNAVDAVLGEPPLHQQTTVYAEPQ